MGRQSYFRMIKKRLNNHNTLIQNNVYPMTFKQKHGRHQALLGIGGNIGDVMRRFKHLLVYLKRSTLISVIETSPILKNPAFGYVEQDDFYNALLLVETQLTAKQLLRYVLSVEKVFGRKRSFPDAPRTLDIDILFYDNMTMNTQTLILPHPRWHERNSVLIPLSYMKKVG